MRSRLVRVGIVMIALAAILVGYIYSNHHSNREATMNISSPAFENNAAIPKTYSCQGENINPPIDIQGVPKEAQTLAVIVDDPDAPGGTFVHWVIWNISPHETSIPKDWTPAAGVITGANGTGQNKYMGPCPPSGTHHYHFKVYAIDRDLDLAAGSSASDLTAAMAGHIVGNGELVGTYAKQ